MAKLAMISFFRSSNLGDLLLSEQLLRVYEGEETIAIDFPTGKKVTEPFTPAPPVLTRQVTKEPSFLAQLHGYLHARLHKRAFLKAVTAQLQDVDAIVLGGGNMLMDLGMFPEYTYRALLYTEVAKKLGIPIYTLAVGVGPFRHASQKRCAKKVLMRCTHLFVRDSQSQKVCRKMGVHADVCGDAAFFYTNSTKAKTEEKKIAVCIADYHCVQHQCSKTHYIAIWQTVLRKLRETFPQTTIQLYSSERGDYPMIAEILETMEQDRLELVPITTVRDLCDLYAASDAVIAMRMHSLIVAMLSGVHTVAMSWQAKVDSLFSMCRREDYLFDVTKMDGAGVERLAECCQHINVQTTERQTAFVKTQKESFSRSAALILSHLPHDMEKKIEGKEGHVQ